jgi:predicted  nucleic acid-binding Zn-ribbon protein
MSLYHCAACAHSFHSDADSFEPEGCPECGCLSIDPGAPVVEPSYDDSREVTGRGEY